MKKTLVILLAALSLVSMNLFAWGQKESKSSKPAPAPAPAAQGVDAISGADGPIYTVPANQPVVYVKATGENAAGAETGTAKVIPPSSLYPIEGSKDKAIFSTMSSKPSATVPYVSGGYEGAEPCSNGTYPNVTTNFPCSQSPTASGILTDPNHGGPNSTMMPLPNSDGNAIHQANNKLDVTGALTAGCIGITTADIIAASAQQNYSRFSSAANANGNTATVIKR